MKITFTQRVTAAFILVCSITDPTFAMMEFATKSTIQSLDNKVKSQQEDIQKLDKRLIL